MPLHLILLGPPASGKGTQGRRLAEKAGLAYLSTGALLREAVDSQSEAGRLIAPVLARGGYISDELMCSLMEPWLERHLDGWVLDGFPRTLAQDTVLNDWLERRGQRIDAAIALEAPKAQLVQRIENRVECPSCRWSGHRECLVLGEACPECDEAAGARPDDSVENFLSRFDEFELHAVPVIERYAGLGRLRTCDATAPILIVFQELQQILLNL